MDIIEELESRNLRILPLLLAIFFVGFSIVYISHGPRLADPDAWFQFMMAEYVVEEGGIPYVHELAYYPNGRFLWAQDNLFLPYFFAYTYMLVKPLGISMMGWAMMFPAIFGGGLAAVALYLAAAGAGHLRICDGDRIESSNLNRQILYSDNDIGKQKATNRQ